MNAPRKGTGNLEQVGSWLQAPAGGSSSRRRHLSTLCQIGAANNAIQFPWRNGAYSAV